MARLALPALLLLAATAAAPDGPRRWTLADLAWMEGVWRASETSAAGVVSASEETWGPAIGESRLGTFRMVRGGRVRFYEFMLHQQDSAGVTMKLRHFGGDFRAFEPRDTSTDYRLVEAHRGEARFERPEDDDLQHMVYRLVPGDSLVIRLHGTDRASGQPRALEFRLARVRPAAPQPARPEHPE